MYSNALSPSSYSPQPFLKDFKSDHHHSRKNESVEDGQHKRHGHDDYKPSSVNDTPRTDKVASTMAVQSVVSSISKSAEIEIKTKEGDVVTISLSEFASSSQAGFEMEQGGNKISAYGETRVTESGFSLSIEGDLSEDEEKALAGLIDKMTKVSDKFFSGDINAAFKHAQKVGFDSEQIAGFSMDLNMQKSVQAVAAYQQTVMPDENVNTDMLGQARDFLAETKQFMAGTAAILDSIAEPKQAFGDLFMGVGQMQQNEYDQIENVSSDSLFLKMIENVAGDIFSNLS